MQGIAQEDKNKKQKCYFYGFSNGHIQNELLFSLPHIDGCKIDTEVLKNNVQNMEFQYSRRSLQGVLIYSFFRRDHLIYCHNVDDNSDKTNEVFKHISRFVDSFCRSKPRDEHYNQDAINTLSTGYSKKTKQAEDQYTNVITEIKSKEKNMANKFIQSKSDSNPYYAQGDIKEELMKKAQEVFSQKVAPQ